MLYFSILSIAFVLLFPAVQGDQVPITDIQLYTEVGFDVQNCVEREVPIYITSFGCPLDSPAQCLCTDASQSYRVASGISSCALEIVETLSEITTATDILASYCLTNAGVSARDQTLLQDFPIFNEAGTFDIRDCATSVTSQYSKSYGCDFVTPAACLCSSSQSSAIQDAMLSCVSEGGVTASQWSTLSILWSSYCDVNLATSATRHTGAVITASGSLPTGQSSAAPSATISVPANTAMTTLTRSTSLSTMKSSSITSSAANSSPTDSSTSASQDSSNLSNGAQVGLAIGCAFGAAFLTMLATWYRPERVGRLLTCGRWPAVRDVEHPERSRPEARLQMKQFLRHPLRTRVKNAEVYEIQDRDKAHEMKNRPQVYEIQGSGLE